MSVIEEGDQCHHQFLRLGRRCQGGMILNAIVKVEEGSKQIGNKKGCSNNRDYPLLIITTTRTIKLIKTIRKRKRAHSVALDQNHPHHPHSRHIQAVIVGIVEINRERNVNHHDRDHHYHLHILLHRVQDQGHDFLSIVWLFFCINHHHKRVLHNRKLKNNIKKQHLISPSSPPKSYPPLLVIHIPLQQQLIIPILPPLLFLLLLILVPRYHIGPKAPKQIQQS